MTVEQKQRVVADRLEVSVVGTAFLLAMDRTLGGVHVQNDPLGVVERLRLPDQLSVQRHQPQQVLFARQHLRLEAVQREVKAAPRSQIFCEPIKRNVGSADTRTASLTSS